MKGVKLLIGLAISGCLLVAGTVTVLIGWMFLSRGGVEHHNVAFDISPAGRTIVFSAADDDLYLFDIASRKVTRLTRTGQTESSPAFSPDGRFMAYSTGPGEHAGNAIHLRSVDGAEDRQVTLGGATFDTSPAFSPDGKRIVFSRAARHRPYSMGGWTWDDWDVWVVDTTGTNLRQVTRQKYYGAGSPKFTGNGRSVIYSAEMNRAGSDLDNALWTVHAAGRQDPTLLMPDARKPGRTYGSWGSEPDVSRDGRLVAFISDRTEPFAYDVCVAGTDGSNARPLGITRIGRYNQQPRFMPDGRSLLYLAGRESNAGSRAIYSLWQVDVDGTNAHEIANSSLFTNPSKWKP